jgi:hypothetical protein
MSGAGGSFSAELLWPESPRWGELTASVRHDFYHLASYARMSAVTDKGQARGLLVTDGARTLFLPIIVRTIPHSEGAWDATSPYGYPGTLVRSDDETRATFAREALLFAREWLRTQGCVSLFVRQNPVLGPTLDLAGVEGAAAVSHGETIVIDLHATEEALWSQTTSGHRNEINRSIRAGHVASIDTEFRHLERFVSIYQDTMTRVGASAYYFFDSAYVSAMREALGASLSLAVVEIGGVVAAAGLFVETCGIVEYHLSGTDPAFMKERPTKLMLHHVRSWAKARGNTVMHLGGGVGGAQDSLFKFKAGFSKGRAPFHTLRFIADPARYATLVSERDARKRTEDPAAAPSDAASLVGFFPAYRRP